MLSELLALSLKSWPSSPFLSTLDLIPLKCSVNYSIPTWMENSDVFWLVAEMSSTVDCVSVVTGEASHCTVEVWRRLSVSALDGGPLVL